jgi:hypothetical protein
MWNVLPYLIKQIKNVHLLKNNGKSIYLPEQLKTETINSDINNIIHYPFHIIIIFLIL